MNKEDWFDLLSALAVIGLIVLPQACMTGFDKMAKVPT